MTWIKNHVKIVCISLLLGVVVIVCLGYWLWPATHPPLVPETATTAHVQTAVTSATQTVVTNRLTNDEAIKTAYEKAKTDAMALSADAIVLELNALLDELRGGTARP